MLRLEFALSLSLPFSLSGAAAKRARWELFSLCVAIVIVVVLVVVIVAVTVMTRAFLLFNSWCGQRLRIRHVARLEFAKKSMWKIATRANN